MKGQFFVVATVIMIITLMALVRYFYGFSDIDLTHLKEMSELEYIPYIKQGLNETVSTYLVNPDCAKLEEDLNATKNLMQDKMIERGIFLNISYVFSCPFPPPITFNVTIKTPKLYTETVFDLP